MTRIAPAYRLFSAITAAAMILGVGLPVVHVLCAMQPHEMAGVAHHHPAVAAHDRAAPSTHDLAHDDVGAPQQGHEGMPCAPVGDMNPLCCAFEATQADYPATLVAGPETHVERAAISTIPLSDEHRPMASLVERSLRGAPSYPVASHLLYSVLLI